MAVLSDFGGFNDGLLIFPAFIMTYFSSSMFDRSTSADLPTKDKSSSHSRDNMIKKLKAGSLPYTLEKRDTNHLAKEASLMKYTLTSCILNVFYIHCLCKGNRAMRL